MEIVRMKSNITRFRAYQLGNAGSSFSYFADGHFTLLEGRLTELSRRSLVREMEICDVQSIDRLHITSWDSDHCQASELPGLPALTRPLNIEAPGYWAESESAEECQEIIAAYIADRRHDNRSKTLTSVTPEYIAGLETAKRLAFNNIFHNPLWVDPKCANDNSTVKHFRRGSFNVLSLGDVESPNIAARLRRDAILGRETDVMILAHHGADNGFTTKNFLRHLEPTLATCSADYDNQYDHPSQEIRGLLNEQGIRLMTTKTGDVIVKSTGDHTGECVAINLTGGSTEISSRYNFTAKKKRLLGFNEDTLRNLYAGKPTYRSL
jgi:competence protein ComEC